MGLTKQEKAKNMTRRQEFILRRVSEGNGTTGSRLAKEFNVSRGTIMNDIAALRRIGYPIQVSSMITEDGMYQALYELPKYLPKS